MTSKFHHIAYETSFVTFILRCLGASAALQVLGVSLFVEPPTSRSFILFVSYIVGVLLGVGLSVLSFGGQKSMSQTPRVFTIGVSEKVILIFGVIVSIPLLPDAFWSLYQLTYIQDIRRFLLDNPDVKIISPKITLVFGSAIIVCTYYYLVFVVHKSKVGIALMFSMLLLKSLLYVSRSEFVFLAIFYFLNQKKIISVRLISIFFVTIILLGLFTIVFQGRTENNDLDALFVVLSYYSAYFGYPMYLVEGIKPIFGEYSISYAILGYPVDVIETQLYNKGGIASNLDNIATPSWVGFDIFGKEHSWGNVLYPQYGFLGLIIGPVGVSIYYALVTTFICIMGIRSGSKQFLWRLIGFIWVFISARSAALGVPNTWFVIAFAILFSILIIRSRNHLVR